MQVDSYGIAVNSPETYKYIAEYLRENRSCIITWTDGRETQLTILFAKPDKPPDNTAVLQGGLQTRYLFVAIMRCGAFGFECGRTSGKTYYAEKLGVSNVTAYYLAELVNGVRVLL